MNRSLTVKIATEEWELEQVHQLNYAAFVREIPQHKPNAARRLVDRFHDQNTYIICLKGRRLVGMLAVRGERPFSLDRKLPDIDSYLPACRSFCEIRLLTVRDGYRHTAIFRDLIGEAARFYKLDLDDIIVFHDELDLAPGKIRVKVGGGNAGHNGLRSISSHLGNDYTRVRIGIGLPEGSEGATAHVLATFAE